MLRFDVILFTSIWLENCAQLFSLLQITLINWHFCCGDDISKWKESWTRKKKRRDLFKLSKSVGIVRSAFFGNVTNVFHSIGSTKPQRNLQHWNNAVPFGREVMGGGSCSKGRKFVSRHHIWMDIFHIHICCKICNVCWKDKTNEKTMLYLGI